MSKRIDELRELDESSQQGDEPDAEDEPSETDDTSEAGGEDSPEPEPEPEPKPDAEDSETDGNQDEQDEDDAGSESETETESEGENETETESKPSTPMSTSEDESETTESEPAATSGADNIAASDPAFTGDDFDRQTIYRLEKTWNEFQDAMDGMDLMTMRQQLGVRNVTAREREEAMVRLARDNPERIAEYVLEARGFDVDLEDSD